MSPDPASGVDDLVIVGRIRRPHGVRGELVIEPMTNTPDVLFTSGRRFFAEIRRRTSPTSRLEVHVEEASPFMDGLIVRFAEIDDVETAQRWRDRFLLVPKDELPQRAEDEVYFHELVGLRVEGTDGEPLGTVEGFYDLPQGLMLDVRHGERTYVLPYRDGFVKRVDLQLGVLVVDLPAGFLDGSC